MNKYSKNFTVTQVKDFLAGKYGSYKRVSAADGWKVGDDFISDYDVENAMDGEKFAFESGIAERPAWLKK